MSAVIRFFRLSPENYFGALHNRLNFVYGCSCTSCNAEKQQLQLKIKGKFKHLLKSVEKAFKKLHNNQKYKVKELISTEEFKQVIDDTAEIFSFALEDHELPEELVKKFKEDVYLFSGLKTHSQLLEASKLLYTKENKLKGFDLFSKDVAKLKKQYNETYLEAEYDYAVGTTQQAQRWESFSDSKRYYLQYRTAGDSRVRDSHQALHNITLPKDSDFWNYYAPKNGWRCRCSVVEVLASTNEASDTKKALKKGKVATTEIGKNGKNKLEIFRYHPAKQKVIFPPGHPYQKVAGAKSAKSILKDEL